MLPIKLLHPVEAKAFSNGEYKQTKLGRATWCFKIWKESIKRRNCLASDGFQMGEKAEQKNLCFINQHYKALTSDERQSCLLPFRQTLCSQALWASIINQSHKILLELKQVKKKDRASFKHSYKDFWS